MWVCMSNVDEDDEDGDEDKNKDVDLRDDAPSLAVITFVGKTKSKVKA